MHSKSDSIVAIDDWLNGFRKEGDIFVLSQDSPFQHPEDDYDRQYGKDADPIEKTIGAFVLDAAGFIPETVLELACGTGHMTASLLHDDRIERIVASDASRQFLELTKRKVSELPGHHKLDLLVLSDSEFESIPENTFDAIMMRSALHHFVDFEAIAESLIRKLKRGGGLFMLEPRADFHIASSLVLRNAKQKGTSEGAWTDQHDKHMNDFVDAARFYLERNTDKSSAEDKYVFHLEEFLAIAQRTNSQFTVLGGEYVSTFTSNFHDFMHYCMSFQPDVLSDIMRLADDDLKFLDHAFGNRPRFAAAEWFLFRAQ